MKTIGKPRISMTRIAKTIVALCAAGASTLAAAAPLPDTSAGALDPTFGNGGSVFHNPVPGGGNEDSTTSVFQPDGKLIIAGSIENRPGGMNSIYVTRLLDDGSPDPAFGSAGSVTLALDQDAYTYGYGPALDANGRIIIVAGSKPDATYRCTIVALRSDGSPDPQFGTNGIVRTQLVAGVGSECTDIAVQPDGKIVTLGLSFSPEKSFVARFNANGTPDLGFGVGGFATLPPTGSHGSTGLALAPNGMIYAGGGMLEGEYKGYLYRLTPDGHVDSQFGVGGVAQLPIENSHVLAVRVLPDGSVLATGHRGYAKQLVMKFTPGGQLAADFGVGGIAEFSHALGYGAVTLNPLPNGKILAGLRLRYPNSIWRFGMLRLHANGQPDATFGDNGLSVPGLGARSESMRGSAVAPDGKIWISGVVYLEGNETAIGVARLLPDEITTPVIEFHNTVLDHYFVTADANEAAAIDAGAAGPGWSRTGYTFKSGGPNKAGRFYGSPETNPQTGLRLGPNSHFYSLETAEIAQVKTDAGWRFESYDFNAWPLVAGQCRDGTIGVKRAYNRRWAENDSNHRYTTSQAVYDQMVAAGWSGEGTVFCAPL